MQQLETFERRVVDVDATRDPASVARDMGTIVAGAATLAACGGGGDASTPAAGPAAAPAPAPVAITPAQASRFLAQSTMGATQATIAEVVTAGYSGWIDAQMAMPRAIKHWDFSSRTAIATPLR